MLSSSQLKKVRDSLERCGDRGTVRDRAKFRRIARGGPIFDEFMDKAYDRYVKEVGKDKAAARAMAHSCNGLPTSSQTAGLRKSWRS
jgi:hypothetical protein